MEQLPCIEAHRQHVDAAAEAVWTALLKVLRRGIRRVSMIGAAVPNARRGPSIRSPRSRRVGASPAVPWLPLVAVLIAGCASAAPSQRATGGTEAMARPDPGMSADAAPLPSVPLPVELERVLRDYEVAWAARSPDALARLFTEDGFVLQSGRPPARGHDEIVRAYTGSGGTLALRALAYTTDRNVGYIVGAYAHGVGKADDGKFILLVRRAPGGPWMIAADMDNSNRPRAEQ